MLRTDVDARRLETDVDAMRAVIAFRRCVIVRVHVDRIVRTSLRARLAPDAAAVVEIDDAIGPCKERFDRADLDARRIGAVIAPHHREQSSCVGKLAFLDVLYPRPVNADGHFMLSLARNSTGMAADTLSVVDDEAVVHIED